MTKVNVVSAAIEPRLKLMLVANGDIAQGEIIFTCSPEEITRDFDCTCGSRDCIGHLKGGFYLAASQMRRALDRGYCTRFMQQQFRRLLDLPKQA